MISVAAMVNTSWVCDPRLVSYALEQAERLICHARAKNVVHNFAWNTLYSKVLHNSAWTPLYKPFFVNRFFEPFVFTLATSERLVSVHI